MPTSLLTSELSDLRRAGADFDLVEKRVSRGCEITLSGVAEDARFDYSFHGLYAQDGMSDVTYKSADGATLLFEKASCTWSVSRDDVVFYTSNSKETPCDAAKSRKQFGVERRWLEFYCWLET